MDPNVEKGKGRERERERTEGDKWVDRKLDTSKYYALFASLGESTSGLKPSLFPSC